MPDLDLIKQEEQECVTGPGGQSLALGRRLREDHEFVRPDGPTIQRTTQAALEQGMTPPRVLDLVRQAALDVPVIIMTYLNPVLAHGVDRCIRNQGRGE